MRVLDAALESTFPDLHERAPGVVGSHVVVVFIGRVFERARLALDDVHKVFELLEADATLAAPADGEGALVKADVALASSTNGEGGLVTQRRGHREDERVEEGARHGGVRAGAAGGSAALLPVGNGGASPYVLRARSVSGHAAFMAVCTDFFASCRA